MVVYECFAFPNELAFHKNVGLVPSLRRREMEIVTTGIGFHTVLWNEGSYLCKTKMNK